MENKYLVDESLLVAIMEYLSNQPFKEVRRMIEALEKSEPARQTIDPQAGDTE